MAERVVHLPASLKPREEVLYDCLGKEPSPANRAQFEEMLAEAPELVESLGRLDHDAREALLALSGSWATGRCAREKAQTMETDLLRDGASQAERLVVGVVINSWIGLQQVEWRAARCESGSIAVQTYWDQRLCRAQARFLRAVETLARVRRLMRPSVQVNVAEKQVNLMAVGGIGRRPGSLP